ncbi:PREDICTED: protein unc-80 homolog [Corvus brachyrhynchos]|uniref:protein unc-80 homolog n=1 Tax=Corvus brachyrhynchos TaxID=85066 RepID=UPI0008165CE1|nr:PREDICTED: protein unc-80 homolog [Corvus brachyrhynchos]
MLESSPAHCSTPGDAGKDLRREGLAESTSQAAYLALKVILVCFERQLDSQWYWLSLQVKEMALRKVGGLALWDFLDFIVRTRIPIFVLLRPFIQCKVTVALAPDISLPEGKIALIPQLRTEEQHFWKNYVCME